MLLRTLAIPASLAALALAAAAPAEATSMYIPPPSHCTGAYCDNWDTACYQWWCVQGGTIAIAAIDCSNCPDPCADAPDACQAVSDVTPIGTCTFEYCGWEHDACVLAGEAHCANAPMVPAACVGSYCNDDYACVYAEAAPQGVCDDDFVVCGPMTCPLMPSTETAGACVGQPGSFDWQNNPWCDGGILCVDPPEGGDYVIDIKWTGPSWWYLQNCVVLYVVA